jgi:hypothetical protein
MDWWANSARPACWTGRGSVWTPSACARPGRDLTGANPVDRAKPGSKLHLTNEGTGLPLSLLVTAANIPDAAVFEALLDDIPQGSDAGWWPTRCRPDKCHADKAYDTAATAAI